MSDTRLVPDPGPRTVLSQDIRPGLAVIVRDHVVEILGEKEDDPNPFGLPWFKFWGRIIASGREGYIQFGPNATIPLAE